MRARALRFAAIGLLSGFVWVACGGSGSDPDVGAPCVDGDSCPLTVSSACVTAWPGGYCTEIDCTSGSCPSGSRCVRGFQFPNVPIDALCLATCEVTSDCRTGYRCSDLERAEPVCVPTP